MQTENLEGQESIFGRDSGFGKMSSALSQVGGTLKRVKKSLGRIFKKSSKRSSKLKNHTFMLLDLRPGAGNMLGAYWEYDPPWLGSFGMLNTSECPKDAVECSLWQILQATAPSRYSLSQTACLGILRRAECRGKSLPPLLEAALRMQAGLDPPAPISGEAKAYHINQRSEGIDLDGVSGALMATQNLQMQTFITNPGSSQSGPQKQIAFAANQRDEVRDLHDVAGALQAQPGMKQQTFVAGLVTKGNGDCFLTPEKHAALLTGGGQAGQGYPCIFVAGFSAGAGASAGTIGYQEDVAPTLKGSPSGNCIMKYFETMVPSRQCPTAHLVFPLLFKTLICCGLRAGEATRLRVKDVDLINGVLQIWETKHDKPRYVPLSKSLWADYEQYFEEIHAESSGNNYFFPNPRKSCYHTTTVYNRFRDALWHCGIAHKGRGYGPRVHDLRHTFAVRSMQKLKKSKSDIVTTLPYLSAYLGHCNMSATQIYLHLTAECYPEFIQKQCDYLVDTIPTWEAPNENC